MHIMNQGRVAYTLEVDRNIFWIPHPTVDALVVNQCEK